MMRTIQPFIRRLVAQLRNPDPDPDDNGPIANALRDTSETFRHWRLFRGDPSRLSGIDALTFTEGDPRPPLRARDVGVLKRALVAFVREHPHHPRLVSAAHALMELAARDTAGLQFDLLAGSICRDDRLLYQVLLSLDRLGYTSARSFHRTWADVAGNTEDARALLASPQAIEARRRPRKHCVYTLAVAPPGASEQTWRGNVARFALTHTWYRGEDWFGLRALDDADGTLEMQGAMTSLEEVLLRAALAWKIPVGQWRLYEPPQHVALYSRPRHRADRRNRRLRARLLELVRFYRVA